MIVPRTVTLVRGDVGAPHDQNAAVRAIWHYVVPQQQAVAYLCCAKCVCTLFPRGDAALTNELVYGVLVDALWDAWRHDDRRAVRSEAYIAPNLSVTLRAFIRGEVRARRFFTRRAAFYDAIEPHLPHFDVLYWPGADTANKQKRFEQIETVWREGLRTGSAARAAMLSALAAESQD